MVKKLRFALGIILLFVSFFMTPFLLAIPSSESAAAPLPPLTRSEGINSASQPASQPAAKTTENTSTCPPPVDDPIESMIEVRYRKVSEKLAKISEPIWDRMLTQQKNSPTINAICIIILLGLALFLRKIANTLYKNNWQDRNVGVGTNFTFGFTVFFSVASIVIAIVAIFYIGYAIKSSINPDFYIIQDMYNQFKS